MKHAFDIASIGAIFFNRFEKVTSVNSRAEECLGPHLQISRGEIRLGISSATAKVRRRINAVLTEEWLDPKNAERLVVERPGMKPLLLRIQRLGGSLPDIFSHTVGVCLIEDLNPHSPPAAIIAKSLGLTPTEAALAMTLSGGVSLRESAETMSMAYETARTHLRAILGKLGVQRQSELVALVSRLKASQHLSLAASA